MDDPRAVIRRAYRKVDDGFWIPQAEEQKIRAASSSPTYGEMTPTSVRRLAEHLALGPRDVFYDLGSGVGKVVNQIAISAPVARCVGVELSPSRVRTARKVLRHLRADGLVRAAQVSFRQQDILAARIRDATVVYTCSTAFPWTFLGALCDKVAGLGKPITFVSVQELVPRDDFELQATLRLDMTWQRRDYVYVYRVTPAMARAGSSRSRSRARPARPRPRSRS